MPNKETFHVRTGQGYLVCPNDGRCTGFTDNVGVVTRSVRQHNRWQSVRYKGKRYILRGGVYTPIWINLALPI